MPCVYFVQAGAFPELGYEHLHITDCEVTLLQPECQASALSLFPLAGTSLWVWGSS